MPRQTEPNANNAMGSLLQAMLSRSQVRSENTRTIVGHPGRHPDILITGLGRSPVVIEAEYMPAADVEPEAKERLGLQLEADSRPIEAVIALRYPDDIGDADDLGAALTDANLSYCVFTEESGGVNRFPASGWLEGSAEDLADLVRLVSVPQRAVDQATTTLQEGIDAAAKLLDEVDKLRPSTTAAIAGLLGMTNMPRHTEPSVNNAMGLLLQTMLSRSQVRSENTRTIVGHPGRHPDILITGLGRSPMGHDSNVVGAVPGVVVPPQPDRPAVMEGQIVTAVQ